MSLIPKSKYLINLEHYLLGVISVIGCYNKNGLTVWAPKSGAILLDYLVEAFDGRVVKQKGDRYKWVYSNEEALSLDLRFPKWLMYTMPECDSKKKVINWVDELEEVKKNNRKVELAQREVKKEVVTNWQDHPGYFRV